MTRFQSGRAGSLHAIVAALGGDLYAGGRRANVPAPGHGPHDRSVSLLADGDRLVAHSFGGASWREVLDDLRARGLIDDANRLTGAAGASGPAAVADAPARADRVAAARKLWSEAGPLSAGTPAARHCRARGVTVPLEDLAGLRAHAAAPVAVYRPDRRHSPALLAAAQDPGGALTAVEITYLTEGGLRRRMATPRKVVGALPAGAAVRLAPAADEMLVAEGVFTALAAMEIFGRPGWALLGAHNLARWSPPEGVSRVIVAADNGPVGVAAAAKLAASLRAAGVEAHVRRPPAPYGDWNDVQASGLRGAGR